MTRKRTPSTVTIQTPTGPRETTVVPSALFAKPPAVDTNDPLSLIERMVCNALHREALLQSAIKRNPDGSYTIIDPKTFGTAVRMGKRVSLLLLRTVRDVRRQARLNKTLYEHLSKTLSEAFGES